MAVYGINYEEPKPETYESIYVNYGEQKVKAFESGNFVKDWFDLLKFIVIELSETESHFVGSSTVDHFFMDGADELYDEAFLITDEQGVSELCYGNFEGMGMKLYVPTGTKPTWVELKEMCE